MLDRIRLEKGAHTEDHDEPGIEEEITVLQPTQIKIIIGKNVLDTGQREDELSVTTKEEKKGWKEKVLVNAERSILAAPKIEKSTLTIRILEEDAVKLAEEILKTVNRS